MVCSLQPCCHLLGKGRPLGSLVCDVFLCYVTFPFGVLGQVWFLIVSIPDLCLLYFNPAVRSKSGVLLLFIRWFMYLPMFVGVLCLVFVLLCIALCHH